VGSISVGIIADVCPEGPIEGSTEQLLQTVGRGINDVIASIAIGADVKNQVRVSR
jgi:hypothetical protein